MECILHIANTEVSTPIRRRTVKISYFASLFHRLMAIAIFTQFVKFYFPREESERDWYNPLPSSPFIPYDDPCNKNENKNCDRLNRFLYFEVLWICCGSIKKFACVYNLWYNRIVNGLEKKLRRLHWTKLINLFKPFVECDWNF